MRIIYTLHDLKKAQLFSSFLQSEGIDNQLEVLTNTDWGSPNYGDVTCKIWVVNEDQVEAANRWLEEFENNPSSPIFQESMGKAKSILAPFITEKEEEPIPSIKPIETSPNSSEQQPLGTATLYILILCCILFVASVLTTPHVTTYPTLLPAMPILTAPVKKPLLFDYPHAYEIVDKLVKLYGVERLQNIDDLPPEGRYLLKEFQQTPYWKGFYPQLTQWVQNSSHSFSLNAPLFEKIREGEVWRFITPCFLHSDILHLFFNMIWLIVLGKQIEKRIGIGRYLLLILISGSISNTAQYLMSGPNFIGFSGVLCAMLAFIWIRQKRAAWEGYMLQGSTMAFMAFFILSMVGLQLLSFYLEAFKQQSFSTVIANTAHLTGALCGVALGWMDWFAVKLR